MPVCKNVKRRKKQVCTGDLDTLITLQGRTLTPPTAGVDATEVFEDLHEDIWSLLETGKGTVFFDDTNKEVSITHEIIIVFIAGITQDRVGIDSEVWVLFEGKRFNILFVEDFDERHEYLLLRCNIRGTTANKANEA